MINARQNAPYNPTQLELAARNEEEKVIGGQGTLIQKDAVPKSYTSFNNKMPGLWASNLTKNPLSAGWYAPAAGAQSGFGIDFHKAQAIAASRRSGDFADAAAQGYDALTRPDADISKLSTNEGAVRMAADLALDSAKAFIPEQFAIPAVQGAVNRYNEVVNSILGIDPEAAKQILPQILYTTTVQGSSGNQAAGTIGLLSSILRLGENALKTVTDHVLGEDPSLKTAQTMFRVLKLRDMETGTKSEAFQAAEAALMKTTGNALQNAAAQTGESELDDLTGIAGKSSHNLNAVMKRWGLQGVNYIGNLLKAGRGDLAAAITAMPTYAKSAIVAETNMRTFGLNDMAIAAQENALAADIKSPIVVLSAMQIAKQQAMEARKAEIIADGGPLTPSILVQKVNEAGKTANQSKSALDQSVRNEQAGWDALTKAQAAFHKNIVDTAAADVLVSAIDNLQKATDARVKAQKTFALNQQARNDAQQKLNGAQKHVAVSLDEQAKQDVDAARMKLAEARAKLMGKAGGLAGERGNMLLGQIQSGNVSNEGKPLAQMEGSSIIKENTQDLGLDTAAQQKMAEAYLNEHLLSKDAMLMLKTGGKSGSSGSELLRAIVPGNTLPSGLQKDVAETLPDKGNAPSRKLALAGAETDVGYSNGYQNLQAPGELLSSSGGGNSVPERGKDGDAEVYWKDNQPAPAPSPSSTQTPSTTPEPATTPTPTSSSPKYTIDLAGKSGYAKNQNAYPGATETTLMPLMYFMQAEAKMVIEEYPYAADQIISGNEKDKRSECVGMSRLPGVSWYPPARKENGIYVEDRYPRMFTTVGGLYRNSTHSGNFTADTEKFDAMHLITKGEKHVVVYWKEFFDGEKMHYNVVVHNSGKKYMKIEDGTKPEEIAAAKAYNADVDKYNAVNKNHAEIVPFDEACEDNTFVYWCAPDYIDYGDQRDPDTGELLTPKKQWK